MSDPLYALAPVDNFFRMRPKGIWGLSFDGNKTYVPGGDYQSGALATEVEKTEIYSNETPTPVLAMTDYGQVKSVVTIECRQMPHEFLHILYKAAKGLVFNQVLAADQEFVLEDMPAKRRAYLPHGEVTVDMVSAVDDADDPVEYIKNVHYRIHKKTGLIEINAHPEGVVLVNGKADITVAYDAAAITGRPLYGLNSNLAVTAGFQWLGVGDGPQPHMRAWVCEAEFSNIQLGADGAERATASLTLTILADPTQDPGLEYARIEDITTYPA